MRLSECAPGQGGVVSSIQGDGLIVQRLMEMGLIEGATVKVVRVAPLGDPIEIEINEYLLTMRKSEAAGVEIDT